MRWFGNALLVWAAMALIASPFYYQYKTRGHWRDSPMGWHLMSYMGVFAAVVTFAILNFALELPEWVRPLTWFMVGVVAWWRLLLLGAVQNKHRGDDHRNPR